MAAYQGKNILTAKIRPFLVELCVRCGSPEAAAEYCGLGVSTLYRIIHREHVTVQRRTAEIIISSLGKRRRLDKDDPGAQERINKAIRHQAKREDQIERMAGY